MPLKDLTGKQFNRLTVIKRDTTINKQGTYWNCKCSCGETVTVRGNSLTGMNTQSCGCLSTQLTKNRATTHGMSKTPIYSIYIHIINRCNNPNDDRFKDYGGRGITICDEWRHDFMAFFKYVGNRPSNKHSIDRINNDGNYEPGNVRWSTAKTQSNNNRANHKITVNGKTMNISQWVALTKINRSTLIMRIRRGWPPAKAIFQPVNHHKNYSK